MEDSLGFVESGRHVAIKIKTNNDIENIGCYINNKKVNNNVILKKDNYYILDIKILDDLKPTLKSWSNLRDVNDNYFNINTNDIGNRINIPNILKIVISDNEEYQFKFDNIDCYKDNMNYTFYNNVENINNINTNITLDKWINDEK